VGWYPDVVAWPEGNLLLEPLVVVVFIFRPGVNVLKLFIRRWQSDQKIEQKTPKFGNVAKTVAKAQIESPKHLHPTAFNVKISTSNSLFS
jgi:hypothetical protein